MAVDLLAVTRDAGVTAVEHGNWRGRVASGSFSPVGLVIHHTAGRTSLGVVLNGRPGIPGPLCNWLIDKQGTAHMISNGKANDTGKGSGHVLDEVRRGVAPAGTAVRRGLADTTNGNAHFYDIEIENLGDGRDGYPPAQLEATLRLATQLCRRMGWTANRVIGHKEWSKRKIDPNPIDMAWFRDQVRGRLAGSGGGQLAPPVMKRGDTGTGVATWQAQMRDTQGWDLKADGVFGEATEAATRKFQKKYGLPVTGEVDDRALQAMGRVYAAQKQPKVGREQAVVTTPGEFDRPLGKALAAEYGWAHVGSEESDRYEIKWAIAVGGAADVTRAQEGKTELTGEGREQTAAEVVGFAAKWSPEEIARRGDPERKVVGAGMQKEGEEGVGQGEEVEEEEAVGQEEGEEEAPEA